MKPFAITLCFAALLLVAVGPTAAQVTTPVSSPYAMISEQVGLTDITIRYGRPGVKGRTVWGGLVPYGFANPFPNFGSGNPYPWRAGANENTTITFSDDVLIEGERLAAGTYGLHMIPSESDWVVIFSENSTSWGSFFYNEAEDALRVTVTPAPAPFKERLAYEFMDQDEQGGATIALLWDELKVPFRVQVADYHETVLASMRNELRSSGGFGPQGWQQAANYCAANQISTDECLGWAEQAVQRNATFATLRIKADLLAQRGDADAAETIMTEALASANENQINQYGYQLLQNGQVDKAIDIFTLNVERYPDSWNVYDSLGEGYAAKGDTDQAITLYQKALEMAPEAQKPRIRGILDTLGTGSN